jgi:hypothetical protein
MVILAIVGVSFGFFIIPFIYGNIVPFLTSMCISLFVLFASEASFLVGCSTYLDTKDNVPQISMRDLITIYINKLFPCVIGFELLIIFMLTILQISLFISNYCVYTLLGKTNITFFISLGLCFIMSLSVCCIMVPLGLCYCKTHDVMS